MFVGKGGGGCFGPPIAYTSVVRIGRYSERSGQFRRVLDGARKTYMIGWAVLFRSDVVRSLEASVSWRTLCVCLSWSHCNEQSRLRLIRLRSGAKRWVRLGKPFKKKANLTHPNPNRHIIGSYRVGVCLPFRRFAIIDAWLKKPRVITDGFNRQASPSTCMGTDMLVVMRAVLHWHSGVPVPPVCSLVWKKKKKTKSPTKIQ